MPPILPLDSYLTAQLAQRDRRWAWLAKEVGVSTAAVAKWRKFGQMSDENIIKVAEVLGVSTSEVESVVQRKATFKKAWSKDHSNIKVFNNFIRLVPILGMASCGDFCEVFEHALAHSSDTEMLPAIEPCGPRSFWTVVSGQSMYNPAGSRSYKIGDRVLMDCDRAPEVGKAVIAQLATGECTMKCYQVDGNGKPFLLALNPEWDVRRVVLIEGVTICACEVAQLVI